MTIALILILFLIIQWQFYNVCRVLDKIFEALELLEKLTK